MCFCSANQNTAPQSGSTNLPPATIKWSGLSCQLCNHMHKPPHALPHFCSHIYTHNVPRFILLCLYSCKFYSLFVFCAGAHSSKMALVLFFSSCIFSSLPGPDPGVPEEVYYRPSVWDHLLMREHSLRRSQEPHPRPPARARRDQVPHLLPEHGTGVPGGGVRTKGGISWGSSELNLKRCHRCMQELTRHFVCFVSKW